MVAEEQQLVASLNQELAQVMRRDKLVVLVLTQVLISGMASRLM
jgi:hypothetical protein